MGAWTFGTTLPFLVLEIIEHVGDSTGERQHDNEEEVSILPPIPVHDIDACRHSGIVVPARDPVTHHVQQQQGQWHCNVAYTRYESRVGEDCCSKELVFEDKPLLIVSTRYFHNCLGLSNL